MTRYVGAPDARRQQHDQFYAHYFGGEDSTWEDTVEYHIPAGFQVWDDDDEVPRKTLREAIDAARAASAAGGSP